MVDGDELGDHPTHRCAHDMGAVDVEFIEQAHDILGHVLQGVWDERPDGVVVTARSRRYDGSEVDGIVVELGRQAAVTIVEPDDEPTVVSDLPTQLLVPGHELGAESGDRHDRRIVWRPDRLVGKFDACSDEHLSIEVLALSERGPSLTAGW
jgi:hypothetical protein